MIGTVALRHRVVSAGPRPARRKFRFCDTRKYPLYAQTEGTCADTNTLPLSGTSAGGGYSTVHDLFLFAQALQSGKLLSTEFLREVTRGSALRNDYGIRFMSCRTEDMVTAAGVPGINAEMHICLTAATCWLHWRIGTREWRRIWSILPRSTTSTKES